MAPEVLKVLDALKNDEKCIFCRQNFMDELLYGKVYQYGDVITHYFCMLFSAHMEQNGKDEEGILGFLPADIKKEAGRGSKFQCAYCHHEGATVSCLLKSCKKKFHYPCGVENGSMHQFFGQFRSFCVSHRRMQNVPQYACKLTEKYICLMCQDEVKPKPALNTIWAPCCKTAWFHKTCVQKMAVSAGYFFKCPNCNNKEEFRKEMSECGIYIPDQDASWELEPNAFQDLAERYNSCDAEICLCPEGRSYGPTEGTWEIMLCIYCGSQGVHLKCGKNQLDLLGQWTCFLCSSVSPKSPLSSTVESFEFDEPGPSVRVLPRDSRMPCTARRGRPLNRRKRNSRLLVTNNDSSSLERKRKNDDSISSDNESDSASCSLDDCDDQTEVVKCNAFKSTPTAVVEASGVNVNRNAVLIESDDNESDVECSLRSTTRVERPSRRKRSRTADSRSNNLICDTVIDLLDSDNDGPSSSNRRSSTQSKCSDNVTSTSKDNDPDEDNDDVVFVGCDLSNTNKNDDLSATALLRFVDNSTVFIVSPTDVKRKGGLENITAAANHAVATVSSQASKNGQDSSSSSCMWEPIPLHKSIIHTFPSNQINADPKIVSDDCTSLDKYISRNISDSELRATDNSANGAKSKSKKPDPSEIICID